MEYLQELNEAMAAIAATVQQSLVQVSNDRRSGGAGIIWAKNQVLTNAHVVRGENPLVTFKDGREAVGKVLIHDRQRDFALLEVETAGISPLPRGNSRDLRPGDWVLAAGHPWGVLGAASAGAVIAVGQPAEMPGGYQGELIQVGLHLRPGHSGGPMVDGSGRLVGLNTMIAGPDVGLAVPIHVIEALLYEGQAGKRFTYV